MYKLQAVQCVLMVKIYEEKNFATVETFEEGGA